MYEPRKQPCVYILASKRNGTLYTGVTSHLSARIATHKSKNNAGFTKRYGVDLLVYAELHESMLDAILREKQIKKWRHAWKLRLIESANPQWRDLSGELL